MTKKENIFEVATCKYDKEPIYRIGKGTWLHYTEFDGDLFHDAKPIPSPVEPKALGPLNARDQSAVDAGCNCPRKMPYTDWSHDPTCPLYFPHQPQAQVESASVEEGSNVCEFCGPKCFSGAEHNARVEDGARWNDPEDVHYAPLPTEPKEVEPGGLPPLEPNDDDWERAKDNVPMYARDAYMQLACRERQLKTSLLREKELEDEVERLKNELFTQQDINEAFAAGKVAGRVGADSKLKELLKKSIQLASIGYRIGEADMRGHDKIGERLGKQQDELIAEIKAAVTGE